MDNSGDIQNFKISENLINDVNSSGIYIKSNNASIFNNLINGSYNIESIKVGPNTHNVKIISNDLNQSRDGETIVIEPHSDAIIHNNFIKGKFYSVYSKTIVNKWIFKGNWIIELILNNLNFDPYNSTKIDTGINLLEYSSIYKGIFQCYGTITGIDSNNINHCAMFNTNMLISENFHPIGQRGKFIDADDLDLFHSISIDVYMDNIQLIVTNNHPTLHLNNVMIYCTITKNSLS